MSDSDLVHLLIVAEIGTVISVFLFGITTVQAYTYYSRFPDDRWQLKLLVITVFLLELGHVIAVLNYFYTISILYYGQPEKVFIKAQVGIDLTTLLGGYIACLVQAFFADRVRKFTGKTFFAMLCWFLSFLRFLATTGVTVVLFKASLADFEDNWRWLVTACLVIGAVVDVIIAVLLCYHLAKERKTSFKRTTRLIDRIIIMTIQTGLVTSLMTIAVTTCFLALTTSYIWVALYMCLARVFSNSLFATLNARTGLRQMTEEIHSLRFAQASENRQHSDKIHPPKLPPVIGIDISGRSQSTLNPENCSEYTIPAGVSDRESYQV